MEFRDFIAEDAKFILNWIENERELRLWSADRYGTYPIAPDDIISNYEECKVNSNFYAKTLVDNGKVVGHIILRNPDENDDVVRLGFIIVDKKIRKKGYGKILINEAIRFAKEELNAKKITLGVFKNNDSAYYCYKSVGFREIDTIKNAYNFNGEKWDIAEMELE